ncbi:ejaculatory bulb-specific protein 3-like [Agrilus planipennis]|uniref:Ejaculatory bulb-specific protein 3-like n=1 Tax=Agrilus planipennis TaxID=224129 RepID=A0A1W4WN11_AGRPL|nr:ejaculatory bulb-specific protein 3-like [Agrilus planipennis]
MANSTWVSFCIFFAVLTTIFAQHDIIARLQSINLDEVVNNDRLFNNFYKCLTDEGRCSKDAKSVKNLTIEIVKTKCSQCTDDEKSLIKKSLDLVKKRRPEQFKILSVKYDPEDVLDELKK